jgi:3-deoxy-manno-octulosonate cytidylyltransferase (CMP-KDO synthetase)
VTDFHVVIPARFASTRLPGKPLHDIAGKPMIVRVLERCQESGATSVVVATDDKRIADVVEAAGGRALMTRDDHVSGTDRLEEVANHLALADDAIVVNVQGDEPLIPAAVIDQVASLLSADDRFGIATLCEPITSRDDVFNPNVVKTVFDASGRALYFSRAPMPWWRDGFDDKTASLPAGTWWRHIGIYAYRAGLLHDFVNWPPAALETTESLEQLRAMANGVAIAVQPACADVPGGVDTQADLDRVAAMFGPAS